MQLDNSLDPVSLADRLHSAAIHLLRRLRRTDPDTGVTAAQLSALSLLMGGPKRLGDMAGGEQVKAPTMSRLVRDMEVAGLVTRERDESDSRVVWINWTPKGEQILMHGRRMRVEQLARQIGELSEEDRQALVKALAVLDKLR